MSVVKNVFPTIIISLILGVTNPSSAKNNTAAGTIDNQIITHAELEEGIADKLYEAEMAVYNLKYGQLRNLFLTRLMMADPASKNMSPDNYLRQNVLKNTQVSADEVDSFIKQRKVPAEKINPEFKRQVKQYLQSEKSRVAINRWIDSKAKAHGIASYLKKPSRPRREISIGKAPVWGDKNAPITIIEYSDFQCPYCAKAEKTLALLKQKYKNKIKIVYKQFPLDFHKNAFKAAEASLCANEQSTDLFWSLHDHMFSNIKNLSVNALKTKAASMKLDYKQFTQCLDSGKYANQVNQDLAEGQRFGVTSTPNFFVNGIRLKGAQPLESFVEIIEEELAK